VLGAVLCGGASRRMGADKALIRLEGRPLAARVARALAAAGAARVVAVGGDARALRAAGLEVVPDRAPGEGPLGGLVTALTAPWPGPGEGGAAARRPPPAGAVVLVVACDLVAPSADAFAATVAALLAAPGADAAVPVAGGRRQWLHAAWRAHAGPALARAFAAGERAVHAAVAAAGLRVVEPALDPAAVADADVPEALPPGARPAGGPRAGEGPAPGNR
jgi:molybdopterin-guanine dinucleotide biosynthesis protein A